MSDTKIDVVWSILLLWKIEYNQRAPTKLFFLSYGNDCQLLTIQNIPIRRSMGLFTPNTANNVTESVCNSSPKHPIFGLWFDVSTKQNASFNHFRLLYVQCVWCWCAETRDRGVHIRISVGLTYVEILLRGVTDAEGSIPLNHTVKNTVL